VKRPTPAIAAATLVFAAALAAHAAAPKPTPAPTPAAAPAPPPAMSACAQPTDAENLCSWDAAAGTHGRGCHLDVERVDKKYDCNYAQASVAQMSDHKPMCFSVQNAEHILFTSSRSRQFRVRRLVPITRTGANGQACPRDPFTQSFHEEEWGFDGRKDSLTPKASALGCQYKLEVQFNAIDPNAPAAPYDPQHRHLECRDPHLGITN
jgi:hypothetical protein